MAVSRAEWEQAEVARSSLEARLRGQGPDADLDKASVGEPGQSLPQAGQEQGIRLERDDHTIGTDQAREEDGVEPQVGTDVQDGVTRSNYTLHH